MAADAGWRVAGAPAPGDVRPAGRDARGRGSRFGALLLLRQVLLGVLDFRGEHLAQERVDALRGGQVGLRRRQADGEADLLLGVNDQSYAFCHDSIHVMIPLFGQWKQLATAILYRQGQWCQVTKIPFDNWYQCATIEV